MLFYFHMVLGVEPRALHRLRRGSFTTKLHPQLLETGFFESVVPAGLEFVMLLPHSLQLIDFPVSSEQAGNLLFI